MKIQIWIAGSGCALLFALCLAGTSGPAMNPKVRMLEKQVYNLLLYNGEVEVTENGHNKKYYVGDKGRILKKSDHVWGNPNPPKEANVAPAATTITDPDIGATITLAPGTTVSIGSFDYLGVSYQCSTLLIGTFNYSEMAPIHGKPIVPPGTGRKYIVQAKGRAIGALYTTYSLYSASNEPNTQAILTVPPNCGIGVTIRPNYDGAAVVDHSMSPYSIPFGGG
jgi:hypothetical protein